MNIGWSRNCSMWRRTSYQQKQQLSSGWICDAELRKAYRTFWWKPSLMMVAETFRDEFIYSVAPSAMLESLCKRLGILPPRYHSSYEEKKGYGQVWNVRCELTVEALLLEGTGFSRQKKLSEAYAALSVLRNIIRFRHQFELHLGKFRLNEFLAIHNPISVESTVVVVSQSVPNVHESIIKIMLPEATVVSETELERKYPHIQGKHDAYTRIIVELANKLERGEQIELVIVMTRVGALLWNPSLHGSYLMAGAVNYSMLKEVVECGKELLQRRQLTIKN